MSLEYEKRFLWAVDKPDDIDVQKYIGHTCIVRSLDAKTEHKVEIENIVGSLWKPTLFEIQSKGVSYHVTMLDFFCQMRGEKRPEADLNEAFENQQFIVTKSPGRSPLWTPSMGQLNRSRNKSLARRKH